VGWFPYIKPRSDHIAAREDLQGRLETDLGKKQHGILEFDVGLLMDQTIATRMALDLVLSIISTSPLRYFQSLDRRAILQVLCCRLRYLPINNIISEV
jgi:hypothetical protein